MSDGLKIPQILQLEEIMRGSHSPQQRDFAGLCPNSGQIAIRTLRHRCKRTAMHWRQELPLKDSHNRINA